MSTAKTGPDRERALLASYKAVIKDLEGVTKKDSVIAISILYFLESRRVHLRAQISGRRDKPGPKKKTPAPGLEELMGYVHSSNCASKSSGECDCEEM